MKRMILIISMILLYKNSYACSDINKVYPQQSGAYTTDLVYRCSNTGEPSIEKHYWICRDTLEEGYDELNHYEPLCPGSKSEYDRLKEKKEDQDLIEWSQNNKNEIEIVIHDHHNGWNGD